MLRRLDGSFQVGSLTIGMTNRSDHPGIWALRRRWLACRVRSRGRAGGAGRGSAVQVAWSGLADRRPRAGGRGPPAAGGVAGRAGLAAPGLPVRPRRRPAGGVASLRRGGALGGGDAAQRRPRAGVAEPVTVRRWVRGTRSRRDHGAVRAGALGAGPRGLGARCRRRGTGGGQGRGARPRPRRAGQDRALRARDPCGRHGRGALRVLRQGPLGRGCRGRASRRHRRAGGEHARAFPGDAPHRQHALRRGRPTGPGGGPRRRGRRLDGAARGLRGRGAGAAGPPDPWSWARSRPPTCWPRSRGPASPRRSWSWAPTSTPGTSAREPTTTARASSTSSRPCGCSGACLGAPRTIRAVLFANEEFGLDGGKAYAAAHGSEPHLAASRVGHGRLPSASLGRGRHRRAARVAASPGPLQRRAGAGRAAAAPTSRPSNAHGVPRIGLVGDVDRYFDVHHTRADTLDKVDPDELRQGIAALATLVWELAAAPSPAR